MSPVIRIDDEVWDWLKAHARPLEDTPNSVLRRIAGLDSPIANDEAAQMSGSLGDRPARPKEKANPHDLGGRGMSTKGPGGLSRTKPRGVLLDQFRERLRDEGRRLNLRVRTWTGGHRRTRHILEITGPTGEGLFYVKTRSDSSGFWGLNANMLDSFRRSGRAWFVVFLVGPDERGYLLDANDVQLGAQRWSQAQTGELKVHEGPELDGFPEFNNYADLIGEMAARIRQGCPR